MPVNSAAWDAMGSRFIFVSALLLIAGVANVAGGIAENSASDLLLAGTRQVPGPSTWGWIMIIIGVVELLGATAVWARRRAPRRVDHGPTLAAAAVEPSRTRGYV